MNVDDDRWLGVLSHDAPWALALMERWRAWMLSWKASVAGEEGVGMWMYEVQGCKWAQGCGWAGGGG